MATGAPVTATMERCLAPVDAISVQQTPRGCLQECLGCDAKSEYLLYAGLKEEGGENAPQWGYMLEQSSCFIRTCCSLFGAAQMRPFDMPLKVPSGSEPLGEKGAGGEDMVRFSKDWSLPICCILRGQDGDIYIPCCCCLPAITTQTPDNQVIGTTKYVCDMFLAVPKFKVFDASGNVQYFIRPDTCCGGCCPSCGGCGKGSQFYYLPFYIRNPETMEKLEGGPGGKGQEAQVRKVWSGLKKECCTTADNFFVIFPKDSSTADKANILGATVLIDFTQFEDNE